MVMDVLIFRNIKWALIQKIVIVTVMIFLTELMLTLFLTPILILKQVGRIMTKQDSKIKLNTPLMSPILTVVECTAEKLGLDLILPVLLMTIFLELLVEVLILLPLSCRSV